MNGIKFDAIAGDEVWKVEIDQAARGGDAWHVYINNFYRGRIAFVHNEWVDLDRKFETADFTAMVERIVEHLNDTNKGPV